MAIVAVCGAKGAPGVTTTALGLAMTWPDQRRVVLVEADPSGGSLAARWRLGYEPGLLSLAGAGRRGVDTDLLFRHTQQLGSLPVLCGPASSDQARSAVAALAPHLSAAAADLDIIIDLGRLGAWSPCIDLVRSAGLTIVVTRPQLESVQHVPALVQTITDQRGAPHLVTVGDKPYVPAEIAAFAECQLLGTISDDARSARVLSGGGGSDKYLKRSSMWRDLVAMSESIVHMIRPRMSEPGVSSQRALDGLDRPTAEVVR